MSISLNYLRHKSFVIYGLGVTGRSVMDYFHKHGFKNYFGWDDDNRLLKKFIGKKSKIIKKNLKKLINFVDYIVVSPGININKVKLKHLLVKNRRKIITDLDLFYLINPDVRSVVVTGTNGKSTTCKIIDHVLRKNNINAGLGGNIGSPILNLKLKKETLAIIEASSFQLAYSNFVKPHYALLLNLSKDHLDWHGSMNNYIKSKMKIFSLQNKNNYAFINDNKLLKNFKKNKYKSNIKFIDIKKYKKIKNKIKNSYLKSEVNEKNMSFVYTLSKILKIKEKNFINSLKSFKGLKYRHEIVFKNKNKLFINDSKATSFEATHFALKNNHNILWILGGLPKKGDKFKLQDVKKNIIKAYVIGKHTKFFEKYLNGKINFKLSNTLVSAVNSIFKEFKNLKEKKVTILFSPASASYDQFKNFEDRGSKFSKLINSFTKKYF